MRTSRQGKIFMETTNINDPALNGNLPGKPVALTKLISAAN